MRPRRAKSDPPTGLRALLSTAWIAAMCAGLQPAHAASARQSCRFPDGERRVVVQALAASYGASISDCVPLQGPASEPASPDRGETSPVVFADHDVEPVYRRLPPDQGDVPTYREMVAVFGEGYPVPTAPMREIRVERVVMTIESPGWRRAWAPSTRAGSAAAPLEYQLLIARSARTHGVDPHIVEAVMYVESHFEARAQSNKGAVGLMQLMPQTAQQYGVSSSARLFDPAVNIECGTRYLGELTAYFAGRLDLAIAAYNAGPGAVVRYGWRIPPYAETQAYVDRVMQRLNAVR